MIPPINNIDYVVMMREPHQDTVVVVLPNQDSYELEVSQLEVYLRLLKIPEELGALNFVWNFYGCLVRLETMTLEPLTFEQACAFIRVPGKVAF